MGRAAHGSAWGIADLIMKSHPPARKELLSASIQRALQHLLKPIHLDGLRQRRPVAIGLSQLAIARRKEERRAAGNEGIGNRRNGLAVEIGVTKAQIDQAFKHIGDATKQMREELVDAASRLFKKSPARNHEPSTPMKSNASTMSSRWSCACAIRRDRMSREIENVDAFNNRGLAYHSKNDCERAIADYDEAIRLNPKHALAFLNRGLAYYIKKDYDQAIKCAPSLLPFAEKWAC